MSQSDTAANFKKKATHPKQQTPRVRITVFPNWCKGCDLCIEFCPAGVLEHRPGINVVAVHPEKCTACRWCELHCPDFAIFVTKIDESETETEA